LSQAKKSDDIYIYTKSRLPLIGFVDNIDETFSEFKKSNIEIEDDLRTHAYGLREFAFIDINSYYIRVAEEENN
jgi:hypothetical protein